MFVVVHVLILRGRDQDVDEFLRAVVDRLEDESKARGKGFGIAALFELTIRSSITCTSCTAVTTNVSTSRAPLTARIPQDCHGNGRSTSRSRAGPTCLLQGGPKTKPGPLQ